MGQTFTASLGEPLGKKRNDSNKNQLSGRLVNIFQYISLFKNPPALEVDEI